MFIRQLALLFPLFALACSAAEPKPGRAGDHDWPQWRGPNRTDVSTETGLLKDWPKDGPPLGWKVTGLGEGFSTPSVAAGRVFLMGNVGKDECVIALSEEDGSQLWSTKIGPAGEAGGFKGPRSTPTVDGDRLYALGVKGELVCCNVADGAIVWHKNLPKDFAGSVGGWGYCESPLIDGDTLICTPGGKTSLAKLNKKDGSEVWRAAVKGNDQAAYSSAIIAELGGVKQYIQFMTRGVVAVAADDGKYLWRYDRPANGTANCSTPIQRDDVVFAASSYGCGGGLAQVSKDSDGKFTAEQVYDTKKMKNHHGGMVLIGDYVYGSDEGLLTCLEFKTGKVKWDDRAPGKGSITAAEGRLYYRNEGSGDVFLVEATPDKYIQHGKLKQPKRSGHAAWPHPVIANGKLYLRDQDMMFVYDLRAK
jgi:outer membrane protein assembly factor BamB